MFPTFTVLPVAGPEDPDDDWPLVAAAGVVAWPEAVDPPPGVVAPPACAGAVPPEFDPADATPPLEVVVVTLPSDVPADVWPLLAATPSAAFSATTRAFVSRLPHPERTSAAARVMTPAAVECTLPRIREFPSKSGQVCERLCAPSFSPPAPRRCAR